MFCFFVKSKTLYQIAAIREYSPFANSSLSTPNIFILYISSALCSVSLRPSLQCPVSLKTLSPDGFYWVPPKGSAGRRWGCGEKSQDISLPPPMGIGSGLAPMGSPPLSQPLGGSIFPPRLSRLKGRPQLPPDAGFWVTPHPLFANLPLCK